jgi:hypothetical protein
MQILNQEPKRPLTWRHSQTDLGATMRCSHSSTQSPDSKTLILRRFCIECGGLTGNTPAPSLPDSHDLAISNLGRDLHPIRQAWIQIHAKLGW